MKNGVRVVTEAMEHVRSVSVGIWVNTGSVRETGKELGAAHFIEHMVFKGTERRTAEQIAIEMDAVGGMLNAFTSKECTCFYAKVLDEHLPLAMDMLSDIALHSKFETAPLRKEKSVVVEEILMMEDSPEDMAAEVANMLFFGDDPLSRPILGTEKSVRAFTRELLLAYKEKHYCAKNIVIACAGHFEPKALIELVEKEFGELHEGEAAPELEQSFPGVSRVECIKKDIEQVHITLMLPGFARDTMEQFSLSVLNNALGGSMSSRLFQAIREKRGLAYSVYSYPVFYTKTGSFALYAGTGEKQAVRVLKLMLAELKRLKKHGLTEEEFTRCKEQLKGSYLLSMESPGAVMNAIGKVALLQNREYIEAETINRITCVTMEDINAAIKTVLDGTKLCAAFVGRTEPHADALTELVTKGF